MYTEKVCRVCLSESDALTPLWVKLPGENKSLEETINFVVNIKIKLEDGLPDKICKICESMLDLTDTFKKRCLASESILEQQAQEKQSDESQPKCKKYHQENSEIYSEDPSCLPTSISHTSLTDSLREISENDQNIYDLPEHKIDIEEHDVNAGGTTSEQANLDTVQDFEAEPAKSNVPCLIKEEVSEKDSGDNNIENFTCPHCNVTFQTKISYKVHILCSCEPEDLIILKCELCKETFTSKDSFEVHLRTHSSERNSDKTGKLASNNHGDSSMVLFHSEELHQGEDTTDHALPLSAHQTDGASPEEPKLDDMQPTTAEVRSATEDPAAADTSTATVIGTESDFVKVKKTRIFRKKKHGKNLKLKQKGVRQISKDAMKKESTKDTAAVLKLSGTNTDDKVTCATEKQSECFNSTVIGTAGDIHTCDICGYTAATVKSLNSHLKAHAATKRYSCNWCSYLTIDASSLRRHVRRHTGVRPYCCDVCKKKFSQKVDLVRHARKHTGEKPYLCNVCGKKFTLKRNAVYHSRKHTDEKICTKRFKNKISEVDHLRTHTGENRYVCDVCGKTFKSKGIVGEHLKTHTGVKPYLCDVCGKSFRLRSTVVDHLRTHTGEKPFSCDMCGKRFKHRSTVADHMRTHTVEKKFSQIPSVVRTKANGYHYSCDVCEKKFNNKRALVRHAMTHTDERPYTCDVCDKKFRQKVHLSRHLRTLHNK